ncbi:MAG: hypothetical protein WBV06_11725, partial [Acidimicrobiia bacterium]
RGILSHETRELIRRLGPQVATTVYRERLGQATATLERLDEVRQSNPQVVTDTLIEAHDALVAAVKETPNNAGAADGMVAAA